MRNSRLVNNATERTNRPENKFAYLTVRIITGYTAAVAQGFQRAAVALLAVVQQELDLVQLEELLVRFALQLRKGRVSAK